MGFSVLGNGSIMSPIKVWRIHLGAGARQKPTFIRLSKSISFKSCFPKHIGLCIISAFSIGAPCFGWVFFGLHLVLFHVTGKKPSSTNRFDFMKAISDELSLLLCTETRSKDQGFLALGAVQTQAAKALGSFLDNWGASWLASKGTQSGKLWAVLGMWDIPKTGWRDAAGPAVSAPHLGREGCWHCRLGMQAKLQAPIWETCQLLARLLGAPGIQRTTGRRMLSV